MQNLLSNKTNIFIIDILIGFACLAGIYQIIQKAGINALLYYREDKVVIRAVERNADQTPLRTGYVIIEVNGENVSTIEDIEFILDNKAIGQQVSLQIQRDGTKLTLPVDLGRYNRTIYLVILFFVFPLFFALGLFVLIKRPPGDMVALVFHWMSIAVALYLCTTFGRYSGQLLIPAYLARLFHLLAVAITPVLFLHLSFTFPRKNWLGYKKLLRFLYSAVFLYTVTTAYYFIHSIKIASLPDYRHFLTVYNLGRALFALCIIWGVINFIHAYRKAAEESERRKLRWVILGLTVAPLSFIFLWQIPQLLGSTPLVRGEFILLSISAIPLSFTISIVRYHILDIDLIFNRSTVYVLVFTILLLVYSAIVATAAILIGTFTIEASIIVSAVAAVIIAVLFEPARRKVQRFVDKKFFRVRYNYRIAQREFSNVLNNFMDVPKIAEFVVRKLDELLQPERIEFLLLDESSAQWKLIAGKDPDDLHPDLIKTLSVYKNRLFNTVISMPKYLESGIFSERADEIVFIENNIALVFPLQIYAAQNCGFLLLGPKKSDVVYSIEDIDLLKTVVAQSISAIERIHLQQDLLIQHAETQRLDELNKLKSYFVSSISHDLQTPLTSIKMFAELLQTKTNISKKDKTEYLDIIQGESGRLSRLINNVLSFSRVERGVKEYQLERVNLVSIIESVLRTMKYQINQNGFELEIQLPDSEIIVNADTDSIAEAVTNLLDNAIKYSQKQKNIALSVIKEHDYAVIQVSDQGIGISKKDQLNIFNAFYRSDEKKVKALGGAGLGLTQVQHIAEAHNGRVNVKSKPGSGSTFSIFLPLGETK